MQKKVMILGAASGQIPFMNICRSKGYEIVAVSPRGDYPGFGIADQIVYADTSDKELILEHAKALNIDAILTDQTDVSVPSVAYVAENMGLRGIGYEKAMIFSDKFNMRTAARSCGINVPDFHKALGKDEALHIIKNMSLPVIVKPTRNSGSRGVRKISSFEDIAPALEAAFEESKNGEIIIEEFITGKEYLADGLAIDNKYINTDVGEKEYFDLRGKYISKMCIFSSAACVLDENEKNVLEVNKRLVEGIGLEFGITHAEYLVSDIDKKVYLVEIAARGGGVYLSSEITPHACGINTNELVIDYAVEGKTTDITKLDLKAGVSAWRCFTLKPGTIDLIEGVEETKAVPGVYMVCTDDIYKGRKISQIKDDKGKYGPVLVYGRNKKECFDAIDSAKKTLRVTTTDNGVSSEMIW